MGREGVDLAALAAGFGRAVHDAGIPCSPERSVRFARALTLARRAPLSRGCLYWTARAVFVSDHGQVETFDRVFGQVIDGLVDPADARGDRNAPAPSGARGDQGAPPGAPRDEVRGGGSTSSASVAAPAPAGGEGDGPERELALPAASAAERLAAKDFAELESDELVALRALMAQLRVATPPRRSRRARRARRGDDLDVRATLRASHRTGGDPVRQLRRRRRMRPRGLVVICDVSGSMEPYARAFLLFLHSAVGGAHAEAFVFATRLTRLTRALRGDRPGEMLQRAAAATPDWSGGTRIGDALRRFNDEHGQRGMAHGAVVVIVSDGWDSGDPAIVAREMARLRRLAYRVVWVNPRKAAPDFEPRAGGMAAALPFCDALVGGHSLLALADALDAIGAHR